MHKNRVVAQLCPDLLEELAALPQIPLLDLGGVKGGKEKNEKRRGDCPTVPMCCSIQVGFFPKVNY